MATSVGTTFSPQQWLLDNAARYLGKQRTRRVADWMYRSRYRARPGMPIEITNILQIKDLGIVVTGWLIDEQSPMKSIEMTLRDGTTWSQSGDSFRISDSVLTRKFGCSKTCPKPGFVVLLKARDNLGLDPISDGDWGKLSLAFQDGSSLTRRVTLVNSSNNPLGSVQRLLETVPARSDDKRMMFDRIYGPALKTIWAAREISSDRPLVKHYNMHLAPKDPAVSIVIPIYGRYDFIEYQLSQFVDDPDMTRYELLYVVDDPRIKAEVEALAYDIKHIYRISFSIVYLPQNLGFSGANNVGVQFARSQNLLLLNSDIIPFEAGWLQKLTTVVGDDISTTLTGARLLYEDMSIQHDGMEFSASDEHNGLWINLHPAKGMPADLIQPSEQCECMDAITGACILLSRENYLKIGGFDEGYILGDFEDSDLCLKARENGLKIQLFSGVALCHLERQSQSLVSSDRWKEELTYYNCWQHTRKWDSMIKRLKTEVSSAH